LIQTFFPFIYIHGYKSEFISMDYDKTSLPDKYDKGRDHGPEVRRLWMEAVERRVGRRGMREILDLGCGTGRFSQALAEYFSAMVIGIDPSMKMLSQAVARGETSTYYASGSAEAIPLASDAIDMIFISMVLHHFTDPLLAACECIRVLRQGGYLCLRTASSEMISEYAYVPFFPTSRPVLEQRLPSLSSQLDLFQAAGFTAVSVELITQEIASDYLVYADKLATKSDSILASLDNADFDRGLQAVRAQDPASLQRPVTEPIDFVVFRKP
jgi:ubiquinone/menaquinone biosynthesis C-methylase UbiE